jgi:hypothetical protein
MGIVTKLYNSVQALAIVRDHDRQIHAIVTREALEEHWRVGPEPEHLVATVRQNAAEVEAAIVRESDETGRRIVLVDAVDPAAGSGSKAGTTPADSQ